MRRRFACGCPSVATNLICLGGGTLEEGAVGISRVAAGTALTLMLRGPSARAECAVVALLYGSLQPWYICESDKGVKAGELLDIDGESKKTLGRSSVRLSKE